MRIRLHSIYIKNLTLQLGLVVVAAEGSPNSLNESEQK